MKNILVLLKVKWKFVENICANIVNFWIFFALKKV